MDRLNEILWAEPERPLNEYDELVTDIRGGMDLPESMDIPFVETDADMDGFSLEDSDGDAITDETEEVFEIEGDLDMLEDDDF